MFEKRWGEDGRGQAGVALDFHAIELSSHIGRRGVALGLHAWRINTTTRFETGREACTVRGGGGATVWIERGMEQPVRNLCIWTRKVIEHYYHEETKVAAVVIVLPLQHAVLCSARMGVPWSAKLCFVWKARKGEPQRTDKICYASNCSKRPKSTDDTRCCGHQFGSSCGTPKYNISRILPL